MSNSCKTKCIDKFYKFCPLSNYKGGYCCKRDEDCPRSNICSTDNPRAPNFFKYVACPNEPACENKQIYPGMDGEAVVRQVDKYTN